MYKYCACSTKSVHAEKILHAHCMFMRKITIEYIHISLGYMSILEVVLISNS